MSVEEASSSASAEEREVVSVSKLAALVRCELWMPDIAEYPLLLSGDISAVCRMSGLSEDRRGLVSVFLEGLALNQERRHSLDLVYMFERAPIPGIEGNPVSLASTVIRYGSSSSPPSLPSSYSFQPRCIERELRASCSRRTRSRCFRAFDFRRELAGVSLGEPAGVTSRMAAFASAYCMYSGSRERRVNDFGSSSFSSINRWGSLMDPVHF